MVSTTYKVTISFKIKTTFDNLSHLSQALSFTVSCASNYAVTETAYPPGYATTQYQAHLVATSGFTLPTFTSAQNTGCPIDSWQISTVSGSISTPAGLN